MSGHTDRQRHKSATHKLSHHRVNGVVIEDIDIGAIHGVMG